MKPSHKSKDRRNGNHFSSVLGEYGGSEECVIFLVRFGDKCRVKCGK